LRAGSDPEGAEGVPERVGRPVLEAGGPECRVPGIATEAVQVEVAAALAGEEQRRADPGRQLLDRLEHAPTQRHRAQRSVCLRRR
jgi:hypothetical protein